jgi:transketolase
MRAVLYDTLAALAEEDPSVYVIVADLGTFPMFRKRFPDRFINVGVAEPNSVGIAAGLASEGKRVFLYGVAGFLIYRGFEQIKFSIGYWNQPVCIIGSGFMWRFHRIGRGHHAADELALMRLMPNMRIVAPADVARLPDILRADQRGPIFVRLGEGLEIGSIDDIPSFGKDVCVFALGETTKRCVEAVRQLRHKGLDIGLKAVEEIGLQALAKTLSLMPPSSQIVVVEDHVALGGIGSMVRELGYIVARHICLPVNVEYITRDEATLIAHYGFDTNSFLAEFDPTNWNESRNITVH